MEKRRPGLVWCTLGVAALVVGITLFFSRSTLPEGIHVKTKGQPTIGYPRAKVHVVVFEEPKCVNCKNYNNDVFPKLKEEFIDTNKIRYTVIPVSFLPGSMAAAVATLCVYNADPLYPNNDLFFTYLDYIYAHQPDEHIDWVTTDKLVDFAKASSPAINLQKLRTCTDKEAFRTKILKNNDYGKAIMNGRLRTPTVYVNGIEVKEISYDAIAKMIREVRAQAGGKR